MTPLPAGPYLPTSDLVVVGWLGSRVPSIAPGQVATSLPKAVTSWADEGFVQVTLITGAAEVDVPQIRHAYAQLDLWATTPGSNKPPWNKAARLVELVRAATETQSYGAPLALSGDYLDARVQAAYLITEPSRILGDPSGYARFTLDLAIDWVPA